jgi:CheY-like chemotaxis protein
MDIRKLRQEILYKSSLIREELSDLSPYFKKFSSVLIVDDDDMINFFNKKTLETLQISKKVNYVSSGEEGLMFLKRLKSKNFPLLILVDTSMPVMDGFEFLELAMFCNFITDGVTIAFLTSENCQNTELIKKKGFESYIFIQKPLNKDSMKVFF